MGVWFKNMNPKALSERLKGRGFKPGVLDAVPEKREMYLVKEIDKGV